MPQAESMDKGKPGSYVKPYHLLKDSPETFEAQSSRRKNCITNQHAVIPKVAQFQCSECFTSKQLTKVFSTRRSLNAHVNQIHREPRFKCQVCFKPFARLSNLKQHMHVHSLNLGKKYKCDICEATFIAKCRLNRHLFQVHKQKVKDLKYFKCEFYPQEFVYRNYLEFHVIDEHVVDKEFECPTCSKKFIDQHHLDQHERKHNVDRKLFCQICPADGFLNRRNLSHHLKVKHSQLHCNKCFTSLSNKLEFDQHLQSTKKLKFKCGICSEILNSQCNLNIHTNSHSKKIKIGPVPVQINKAKVKHEIDGGNAKILPETQSTKTETKELVEINCNLCSNSFDCESQFKSHRIRVHPNTTWTCNFEQCSKTFKCYYLLKKHKVVHSNYKSYRCAICPLHFTLPKNVKYHVANHHGGPRPCKCPVKNCGMSCFNYSTLHRHSVCHQAENEKNNLCKCQDSAFVCGSNKCSFVTRSEKEVALHYNQQHGLPTVLLSHAFNVKIEINTLE